MSPPEKRLEFVSSLIQEKYDAAAEVKALYSNNNFTFLVTFSEPLTTNSSAQTRKPGTQLVPYGTSELIVRISNPDAALNEAVRVENEVAAMTLMRAALSRFTPKIVPDVYDWSAEPDRKWIIQERMQGITVQEVLPTLSVEQKHSVFGQIAAILKDIQDFRLPESVKGYGGLSFNANGKIITGATTIPCGGPFNSLVDMYKQLLRTQLDLSDSSSALSGWRGTDLRDRLEKFYSEGVERIVGHIIDDTPTLVHGDLTMGNILIDKESLKIVALLDYDFSHIASPLDEFFYSFVDIHGILATQMQLSSDSKMLQSFILNGFPVELPETKPPPSSRQRHFDDEPYYDWVLAKIWNEELEMRNVKRPATLESKDLSKQLCNVYWFCQEVCPPYFLMERWLKTRSPEQLEKVIKDGQEAIEKFLRVWSF